MTAASMMIAAGAVLLLFVLLLPDRARRSLGPVEAFSVLLFVVGVAALIVCVLVEALA